MEVGLLLLRLAVGVIIAAHGAQKLFGAFRGHGLAGTAGFLESLGFRPAHPHAWAVAVAVAEFGGGLLLALGWLTPIGAGAVIAVMVGAIAAVHVAKGFFVTNGGMEYPLVIAAAVTALAFTGPGQLSVDAALGWSLAGASWALGATAAGAMVAWAVLAARHRSAWRAWRGWRAPSPEPQV